MSDTILPISVCVPLTRHTLFETVCLPTIQANSPAEILTETGKHACQARNDAAARATQPWLFFCDDDVMLTPNCLHTLLARALEHDADVSYCDFLCVNHPKYGNCRNAVHQWDHNRLWQANYISTMSLVRAAAFPGFDPDLDQLQDWDVWLTMAERGCRGIHTHDPLFSALFVGNGISRVRDWASAVAAVREKHEAPAQA